MIKRFAALVFFPVLLGFGGCPSHEKETGGTDIYDGCAPVDAVCPEYSSSFYQYWSLPEGCEGGWSAVSQCDGADCVSVEHGDEVRTRSDGSAFTDVWADCDAGYDRIEGEVCWTCPDDAPEPEYIWAPTEDCGPDDAAAGVEVIFELPADTEAMVVWVDGILPLGGNDYEAVSRKHEGWIQVGDEVRITCPTDLYDDRYRVGYR